jgi:transcriptional regulator with XRE-family HTH domain
LAAELRRLRAQAELSREQVAAQTGVNEGTLYRLETARARPQRRTLLALLDLYGVSEAVRSDLLELSKSADGQGWLRPYQSELPEEYAAYISFEAEARSLRSYESLYIPGLLQTEDYARAALTGIPPLASQAGVAQRVQARMERQELLTADPPLELWAILDEAAVRRMVGGPGVMRGQLLHLREAVDRPNITLQVIPFDVGAHPGMPGAYVYMEFGDAADPELVYMDTLAGGLFLEAEADLRRYSQTFNHLRAIALSQAQTTDLISTVIESVKGG